MKRIHVRKIILKSIEISFQYQDQKVTFFTEGFKTLGEMKEKALKKLTNIPSEVHCYYNNIDYSKYENKKLGEIFNNCGNILLKLIQPISLSTRNLVKKQTKIISKSNSNDNSFEQKNESLNNRNKINVIKPKKIKIYDECKLPNLKNFNSSLLESSEKKCDDNLINQIHRNRSDILPVLNNNDNNDNNNLNQINNCDSPFRNSGSKIREIFCYECDKEKITYFCRSCNSFLCKKCISSDKHNFHLIIELDFDNIIQNISSYGILIQKDISDNLELNKNIREFKNMYDDETFIQQKEEINSKFELIIQKYIDIMNRIDSNIKKENKERIRLSLTTYNNTSKTVKKEINNLIDNYKIQNTKLDYKELRQFFKDINDKEETLSYFKKNILKYHLMNEINTKMKSSFDKINKILSEVTDVNNPFHLNERYLQELIKMKIFKIPKSKEEILKEKQEEGDEIIIVDQTFGRSNIKKRTNRMPILNNDD